jgi:hypothetical protein
LTLLRCAPLPVASAQVARFLAITLAVPVRRLRGVVVPAVPNYTISLRLLVLAEVIGRLPTTLAARFAIGRRGRVARSVVWRTWAGRVALPAEHPA